ncbi:right-handed parallel beta-helix repeat-containing protein [Halorubellus sp. PRR65]|uniref:right-handed parallel beta-helix repeat-containing protein n=1 Tax=Halorubellus sp. PRR65 TaxID=3098148 RepID=UPI002B259D07|nr:right-handed parallel beta-helix repeat-containing protein [Halorubellus sp. PRR65]
MTRRRDVLRAVGGAGALGAAAVAADAVVGNALAGSASQDDGDDLPAAQPERPEPRAYEDYTVRRVPDAYDTIQAAVNAADPEDLVLVGPGTYREAVEVTDTPRLTIRGTSRNDVVLDGEFKREDGVLATVDDVVVENMTARHYVRNGFFWSSVSGWRGSYLTAYNNQVYGVYNIASEHGRYEHSYASGHTDSGFYIGQCKPCHAIIADVRSEHNAIGYSGTNAGGYLTVKDSTFRRNMGGIVPNSLDSEADPPQDSARIENNLVEGNDNADAPDESFGYAAFGTGINVAGGRNNEVVGNTVRDHANFGIAAVPMVDDNVYPPAGNVFRDNDVSGSGRADLAVGAPEDGGNVFEDNTAGKTRPAGLQSGSNVLGGDPWVTMVLLEQFTQLDRGEAPRGDWRTGPEPQFDELESMPDPETTPPREAVRRDRDGADRRAA